MWFEKVKTRMIVISAKNVNDKKVVAMILFSLPGFSLSAFTNNGTKHNCIELSNNWVKSNGTVSAIWKASITCPVP
jgi:hypothetical protein